MRGGYLMHITILMPNLPPAVCGIADHSLLLGKSLERLGASVDHLALHCEKTTPHGAETCVWDGTANGLQAAIRKHGTNVLWIQYSGYGFSRKGAPGSLARAIEHVVRCRSGTSIVVCMHETHASRASLGWRTPIIQPLQISVARRIVRAADIVFATVNANLERCIHEYGVSRHAIRLLPITSNLPDVHVTDAERERFRNRLGLEKETRIAAIFGLLSSQLRTITLFRADLASALRRGHIEHIVAVGGEAIPSTMSAVLREADHFNGRMSVLGPAPADDVARILRCCDIGLIPTPPDHLRKSGVVAAFVAAGLEIWMKDASGNTIVGMDMEAFPTWDQIATFAFETMNSHFAVTGH